MVKVAITIWMLSMMCAWQVWAVDIHLLPTQPTNTQIVAVFDKELGQKLLFHRPFDLPMEVERTHKAVVKQMSPWVKLGFIKQEDTRFKAEKMMYGEPRLVSVGGFKYTYNEDNPLVSERGIFYGRPTVQKIFEVSQVSNVAGEYFCQVYLSWQVNDVPDWVKQVDLRQRENRLLRRAVESHEKPFEKELQLILIQDNWQLWQGSGEKKTPQTLF
ncbi:MAG: hypothetical protein HWE18_02515 [Gammaproteobacteria bacterium]|nr:hypothetical protein [Gammaproteobacteria bacterium]